MGIGLCRAGVGGGYCACNGVTMLGYETREQGCMAHGKHFLSRAVHPYMSTMGDDYENITGQAFVEMVCSELPRGNKAVSLLAVAISSVVLCATTGVMLWFRKSLQVRMRFPWLVFVQTVCGLLWMYLQLLATGTILLPESTHMSGVCESVTVATYTGGFMLWCFVTCLWMFRHAKLGPGLATITMMVMGVPLLTLTVWAIHATRKGFQDLPCVHTPCTLTRESREVLMVCVFLSLAAVTFVAVTTVTAGNTFGMNQGVWFSMLVAFVALMVCTLSVMTSKGGNGSAHEIGVVYNVCTAVVVAWYNLSQVLDVCIKSCKGVKTDLGLLSLVEILVRVRALHRGDEVEHPLCSVKRASLRLKRHNGGSAVTEVPVKVTATLVFEHHPPVTVLPPLRVAAASGGQPVYRAPHRRAHSLREAEGAWENIDDAGGYTDSGGVVVVSLDPDTDEGPSVEMYTDRRVGEEPYQGTGRVYRGSQRSDSTRESVVSKVAELDRQQFAKDFYVWRQAPAPMCILLCLRELQAWVEREWRAFPHLIAGFRCLEEVATWKHEFRHEFQDCRGNLCWDVDMMPAEAGLDMCETIKRANEIKNTFFMEPLVTGRQDWDDDNGKGSAGSLDTAKAWFVSVTGGKHAWRKTPHSLVPSSNRVVRNPAQMWGALTNPDTGLASSGEDTYVVNLENATLSDPDEVFVAMLRVAEKNFVENHRAYVINLKRKREFTRVTTDIDTEEESSTAGLVSRRAHGRQRANTLGVHIPPVANGGVITREDALEAMEDVHDMSVGNEEKKGIKTAAGTGAGAGVGVGNEAQHAAMGVVNGDVQRDFGFKPMLNQYKVLPPWHKSIFDECVSVVATYLCSYWVKLSVGDKGPALTNVVANLADFIIDRQ